MSTWTFTKDRNGNYRTVNLHPTPLEIALAETIDELARDEFGIDREIDLTEHGHPGFWVVDYVQFYKPGSYYVDDEEVTVDYVGEPA